MESLFDVVDVKELLSRLETSSDSTRTHTLKKTQVIDSEKYGPVTLRNIEFPGTVKAITGIGEIRIVIEGRLSLNIVNSAKWGREVHLQVYSSGFRREPRNYSDWSRTELYFPLRDLEKLIGVLLELKHAFSGGVR